MAKVLRNLGFEIDRITNVNYSGMEIDIEGKSLVTGVPLYAECKFLESDVDAPRFTSFYGKYITRWRRDPRAQGLFVAVPGVNSHVKGFFRDNCEGATDTTIQLIEEDRVLTAIFDSDLIVRPQTVWPSIPRDFGSAGDWMVIYTLRGLFLAQFIIPPEGSVASRIAFFFDDGRLVSDTETLGYLLKACPDLQSFERLTAPTGNTAKATRNEVEEIVQVRGSSAKFEYQFPAAPEYFFGRADVLSEAETFVEDVLAKRTSARGIILEGNSGWGKSSVVLSAVQRLRDTGHAAYAIDSRSASSSQFILRVIDFVLRSRSERSALTGFDGAATALIEYGQTLEREGKLCVIFLDQFENVFFLSEALAQVRDVFLKCSDAQTNVIFGFCWKTDLVGLTSDFPFEIRNALHTSSRRVHLKPFSEAETRTLIDELEKDLGSPLRQDLRFFLSDFSQGYPWLLKKLCAHVKHLREDRVSQDEIAYNLLNVKELFEQDLRGLLPAEREALHSIARLAPIGIFELGELLPPDIISSLVDQRLVVQIGRKYDVYWDIFRDYLNTGEVPVQENYLLRHAPRSLARTAAGINDLGGSMPLETLQKQIGSKTFYNVVRELRLLGVVRIDGDMLVLQTSREGHFVTALQQHLRERLPRNRLVKEVLTSLDAKKSLTLDDIASMMSASCPYISASKNTWSNYARTTAEWLDMSGLAIYDRTNKRLDSQPHGFEVREPRLLLARRPRGEIVPMIQFDPLVRVGARLMGALEQPTRRVSWDGIKKSTVSKSLLSLEDLGFIVRKRDSISITPAGLVFIRGTAEQRREAFGAALRRIRSAKEFESLMAEHARHGLPYDDLGLLLAERLGVKWRPSTAETNAKMLLDWFRSAEAAPGAFAIKGRRYPPRKNAVGQSRLKLEG